MKKLFVSNVLSVDGYFEDANKGLEWFGRDPAFFDYAKSMLNSADTIMMGRVTYELMAAFWPAATDEDPAITHKMNHLDKIVFSKSLSGAAWNNSRIVRAIDSQEVMQWKKRPGKDIVILGSGSVVRALTELGLIDEYRLIVDPIVLGKGHAMFEGLTSQLKLKLTDTKILPGGAIILYYVPALRIPVR